jgi:hypothetical protein
LLAAAGRASVDRSRFLLACGTEAMLLVMPDEELPDKGEDRPGQLRWIGRPTTWIHPRGVRMLMEERHEEAKRLGLRICT